MECHIFFDQTLLKIFIELWFGDCPFRPSAGERGGCDNRSISAAEPALDRDTQRRDWEVKKSAGSFSLRPSLLETLSHEKSHMLVDLWGMISSPQPTVDVSCWHAACFFDWYWVPDISSLFTFVYHLITNCTVEAARWPCHFTFSWGLGDLGTQAQLRVVWIVALRKGSLALVNAFVKGTTSSSHQRICCHASALVTRLQEHLKDWHVTFTSERHATFWKQNLLIIKSILKYCWWFRNPANSPVEGTVVEISPLVNQGFIHPIGAGMSEPSTVFSDFYRSWIYFKPHATSWRFGNGPAKWWKSPHFERK